MPEHCERAQEARAAAMNRRQPLALEMQVRDFVAENLLANTLQQKRARRPADRSIVEQRVDLDGNHDGGRDLDARHEVAEEAKHGIAAVPAFARDAGEIEEAAELRAVALLL